jgi:ribonuclease HI
MSDIVDAYVDGSVIEGKARWGLIVVRDDIELWRNCGELEGEINSMRQIGGELKGCIEAIRYARFHRVKVRIFYDYLGIEMWVADLFNKPCWRANNEWTQKYREFVVKNREFVHEFKKVKAHTGNRWNEAVDVLARN